MSSIDLQILDVQSHSAKLKGFYTVQQRRDTKETFFNKRMPESVRRNTSVKPII